MNNAGILKHKNMIAICNDKSFMILDSIKVDSSD